MQFLSTLSTSLTLVVETCHYFAHTYRIMGRNYSQFNPTDNISNGLEIALGPT